MNSRQTYRTVGLIIVAALLAVALIGTPAAATDYNRVYNPEFTMSGLAGWSETHYGDWEDGETYGDTSSTSTDYYTSPNCALIQAWAHNGYHRTQLVQEVDLTNVDTLYWYHKTKSAYFGSVSDTARPYVYIDGTQKWSGSSSATYNSWTYASVDVSGYTGNHDVKFCAYAYSNYDYEPYYYWMVDSVHAMGPDSSTVYHLFDFYDTGTSDPITNVTAHVESSTESATVSNTTGNQVGIYMNTNLDFDDNEFSSSGYLTNTSYTFNSCDTNLSHDIYLTPNSLTRTYRFHDAVTEALLTSVSFNVTDVTLSGSPITYSAPAGTVNVPLTAGHTYNMTSTKTGYENGGGGEYTFPLTSDSTGTIDWYMFESETPAANTSTAQFHVIDADDEDPIEDATIILSSGAVRVTNSAGYATYTVNTSESYGYTVTHPSYYTLSSDFNISAETELINVELTATSAGSTATSTGDLSYHAGIGDAFDMLNDNIGGFFMIGLIILLMAIVSRGAD